MLCSYVDQKNNGRRDHVLKLYRTRSFMAVFVISPLSGDGKVLIYPRVTAPRSSCLLE